MAFMLLCGCQAIKDTLNDPSDFTYKATDGALDAVYDKQLDSLSFLITSRAMDAVLMKLDSVELDKISLEIQDIIKESIEQGALNDSTQMLLRSNMDQLMLVLQKRITLIAASLREETLGDATNDAISKITSEFYDDLIKQLEHEIPIQVNKLIEGALDTTGKGYEKHLGPKIAETLNDVILKTEDSAKDLIFTLVIAAIALLASGSIFWIWRQKNKAERLAEEKREIAEIPMIVIDQLPQDQHDKITKEIEALTIQKNMKEKFDQALDEAPLIERKRYQQYSKRANMLLGEIMRGEKNHEDISTITQDMDEGFQRYLESIMHEKKTK